MSNEYLTFHLRFYHLPCCLSKNVAQKKRPGQNGDDQYCSIWAHVPLTYPHNLHFLWNRNLTRFGNGRPPSRKYGVDFVGRCDIISQEEKWFIALFHTIWRASLTYYNIWVVTGDTLACCVEIWSPGTSPLCVSPSTERGNATRGYWGFGGTINGVERSIRDFWWWLERV